MTRCGCENPTSCGCALTVVDGLSLSGSGAVGDAWELNAAVDTGLGMDLVGGLLATTVTSGGGLRHNPSTGALEFDPVAWTSYTPSWFVGAASWSPAGGATIQAAYYKVGRTCVVRGRLVWGETTSFGGLTGAIEVSLPEAPAANEAVIFMPLGVGTVLDSGSAIFCRSAFYQVRGGVHVVSLCTEAGVTVAHNSPIAAWAVNDHFAWKVVYETVS